MNRPKITEKAHNQYLENPELFNYTQELGIYADALEASLAKDGEMLTFMNAEIELLKSKLSERQATEKTSDTDKSEALNMHGVVCCGVLEKMNLGWMKLEDGTKCMPYIKGHSDTNMYRVNNCPSCGKYVRDVLV